MEEMHKEICRLAAENDRLREELGRYESERTKARQQTEKMEDKIKSLKTAIKTLKAKFSVKTKQKQKEAISKALVEIGKRVKRL